MDDNSPHHFDDDEQGDDGLASLDFSAPGDELAGLDDLVHHPVDGDEFDVELDDVGWHAVPVVADDPTPEEPAVPLFTITNPPGTVTVSAFLDGRVNVVELSPQVTRMTESQLADEIVVIARLATQDARSAQYAFMLEGMRLQGHDDAATRDFLRRDLDLPSPEDAERARASLFSTRYAGDHE